MIFAGLQATTLYDLTRLGASGLEPTELNISVKF